MYSQAWFRPTIRIQGAYQKNDKQLSQYDRFGKYPSVHMSSNVRDLSFENDIRFEAKQKSLRLVH